MGISGEFEKGCRYLERLKTVDVGIVGGGWAGMLMAKEITSRTSPADVDRILRGTPQGFSAFRSVRHTGYFAYRKMARGGMS
jgi:2-polyprenyl-6-methoxyphenol hydroxylase-like FAD-dependent oxidoreductase